MYEDLRIFPGKHRWKNFLYPRWGSPSILNETFWYAPSKTHSKPLVEEELNYRNTEYHL